jgi:hypothetical protein
MSLCVSAMDKVVLIDSLASELGASAVARRKWRQRGVPYRWRLFLIEAARERGVELTSADFERDPGRSVA